MIINELAQIKKAGFNTAEQLQEKGAAEKSASGIITSFKLHSQLATKL